LKISKVVLASMVSASFLICLDSNSQTIKKPLSQIEIIKQEKARKLIVENKKRLAKQKQDSFKTARNLIIRDIDKYCPGCGKG
jgi:hypothetical protein